MRYGERRGSMESCSSSASKSGRRVWPSIWPGGQARRPKDGRHSSTITPTASPRWICSIRRECLDHVIVFGKRHLRHVLLSYLKYYNEVRTHLSLEKDAPVSRAVERAGSILCRPVLGGLHHQYVRI